MHIAFKTSSRLKAKICLNMKNYKKPYIVQVEMSSYQDQLDQNARSKQFMFSYFLVHCLSQKLCLQFFFTILVCILQTRLKWFNFCNFQTIFYGNADHGL